MGEPPTSADETNIRQLAAILAADVVGYSRLMERDEQTTLNRVRDLRKTVIEPRVAAHRGRVFKTNGDGFLVEFSSVVDAVHCAVEIQRATADRDQDLPEDQRLRLRIGVNLGDIFREGDDVFGDGVNIAARLEALAQPGGITLSRSVHEQIREKLDFDFQDLGEHQVKNIVRPIQVYRVRFDGDPEQVTAAPLRTARQNRSKLRFALVGLVLIAIAGVTAWQFNLIPSPGRHQTFLSPADSVSFAVLPFDVPKDDVAAQDYAGSLADGLITRIGSGEFADPVLSREAAASALANGAADTVGRRLKVAFVIRGTVRRRGDNFETSIGVADVATARSLGVQQFVEPVDASRAPDRPALVKLYRQLTDDAFAVARERILALPEDARDAREIASLIWGLGYDKTAADKAVALLEQAQKKAPNDQYILALLGYKIALRAANHVSDNPEADIKRADELLNRVLATDQRNLVALHGQVVVLSARGRWPEAVTVGEQILKADPINPPALLNNSIALLEIGRAEEALAQLDRLSLYFDFTRDTEVSQDYGNVYLALGRYEEAAAKYRQSLIATPAEEYSRGQGQATLAYLVSAEALSGNDAGTKQALKDFYDANPKLRTIRTIREHIDFRTVPDSFIETVIRGLRKAGVPE